jgi:hypothetical protein
VPAIPLFARAAHTTAASAAATSSTEPETVAATAEREQRDRGRYGKAKQINAH